MARRVPRTSVPIVLGTIAVPLTVAILVGWTIVVARSPSVTGAWLLVLGIISLSIILLVLVLLSLFLLREMVAAQRQFGFIDSVTHELKSPLASVKLGLETLRRPDLPPEKVAEVVEMVLTEVERLSGFIGDVLQANRVVHGQSRRIEAINVADMATTISAAVARRHHIPVADIVVDVPPDLQLWTDPTAVETVLTNLIDNAVKYSDPPVEVRVEARRDAKGRTSIAVIDHGIGLERAEVRRVFGRFYRVESEAVRRRRGTGLGLYVAHVLARALGGRLELESEGPGLGATVRFTLGARAGQTPAERGREK